jgi:hypothetical protein
MMLLTAGWVFGLALVLLLASIAVYEFDTSSFGRDDPPKGFLYSLLTLGAAGTLTAATVTIYKDRWRGSDAR